MSQNLTLEIVTPQSVVLETEAEYVTIPGEMGEIGILPSHIPLLTNLQSGVLSYKSSGAEKKIAVHFGYAEVCHDKVTVLADAAELPEEINVEQAKSDQQKAEAELAEIFKDPDKVTLANEIQQQIKIFITRQNVTQ